ncbi:MAG: hypothetical protein ACWGQW_02565 [bacterium]
MTFINVLKADFTDGLEILKCPRCSCECLHAIRTEVEEHEDKRRYEPLIVVVFQCEWCCPNDGQPDLPPSEQHVLRLEIANERGSTVIGWRDE